MLLILSATRDVSIRKSVYILMSQVKKDKNIAIRLCEAIVLSKPWCCWSTVYGPHLIEHEFTHTLNGVWKKILIWPPWNVYWVGWALLFNKRNVQNLSLLYKIDLSGHQFELCTIGQNNMYMVAVHVKCRRRFVNCMLTNLFSIKFHNGIEVPISTELGSLRLFCSTALNSLRLHIYIFTMLPNLSIIHS